VSNMRSLHAYFCGSHSEAIDLTVSDEVGVFGREF
jgi:hypothetical protein